MANLEEMAARLAAMSSGSGNVWDVLMQMNDLSQAESGLDLRTWILVRLAALAASGGPEASYAMLLALCEDSDVSPEDMFGALVAIGPVIGSPRLAAAAEHILAVVAES